MADALDLGSSEEIHAGSTPAEGTKERNMKENKQAEDKEMWDALLGGPEPIQPKDFDRKVNEKVQSQLREIREKLKGKMFAIENTSHKESFNEGIRESINIIDTYIK